MASSRDERRRVWEARLARYRASGLSVARFCQREGVSKYTFYEWAKRLEAFPGSQSAGAARASRPATSTPERIAREVVVCFRWSGGREVLVPAECLDAIRCLAECLAQAVGQHTEAFQEVVVKA